MPTFAPYNDKCDMGKFINPFTYVGFKILCTEFQNNCLTLHDKYMKKKNEVMERLRQSIAKKKAWIERSDVELERIYAERSFSHE